ncbi:ectoine/hydroxyectoine ABC transporter permease subunit EhuC [Actinomadura craniellae]|uniref:Ectoine/hydroxyectoine ABC transporter permease subunit EhuC n=2 Tax=Actinomadura craniellae TaxID=2231787 RepID=A0A365H793_9ACTN|nr:ectoine/hydroxyectoine ABC transporter permease subunit EhuC [Actinomadura craniellae]
MPFLCGGAWITVQATLGGMVLATALALAAGLAALSRRRAVRAVARVYLEFFRGTSVIVQMFWIFFALPVLTGYRVAPLFAGILALGLNLGAYGSEVVRGAVQAVPQAQREAAVALNLTPYQRMRYVILPQALVGMIPPLNNTYIELLKATSLVSAISVGDLIFESKALINTGSDRVTVMVLVMLFYLLLAAVITLCMRTLERRAARMVGRDVAAFRLRLKGGH